jgi:hypothetical protein
MSPNAGGGAAGSQRWVQLYTRAQINFEDLTPYLTCGFNPPSPSLPLSHYFFPLCSRYNLIMKAGGKRGWSKSKTTEKTTQSISVSPLSILFLPTRTAAVSLLWKNGVLKGAYKWAKQLFKYCKDSSPFFKPLGVFYVGTPFLFCTSSSLITFTTTVTKYHQRRETLSSEHFFEVLLSRSM